MSTDQAYYNESVVVLDGTATILIEDHVDLTDAANGEPRTKYTITVKNYEGKIAQEFTVRADQIDLVNL